jgi:hypothetical protein
MSYTVFFLLIGWLLALAIFLGFIVLLRYIHYRERMALINHGINPHMARRLRRSNGILRAGLITMMVGLTLTIGLYPIGFLLPSSIDAAPFHLGPWLLPGLIPLGVGIALITSYYLEQNAILQEETPAEKTNVISIETYKENENNKNQQNEHSSE